MDEEELRDILINIQKGTPPYEQTAFKTCGEIFPTDTVIVRTSPNGFMPMKWGFTGFDGRPVINARSETALEKPMFKTAMTERRCLIPASGYYEWKKDGGKKIKYRFSIPGEPMYFAGCWREEKNSALCAFVILTRAAAPGAMGGAESIHDRMPVIIPAQYSVEWLCNSPDAMYEAVTALSFVPVAAAAAPAKRK